MANKFQSKLTILRRQEVQGPTGLSRSTIYLWIQEGLFPKPINLGPRSVGWVESEIEAWLDSRIEDRDNRGNKIEGVNGKAVIPWHGKTASNK